MKVITNNQPRDLLSWHELTKKEQEEFDYLQEDVDQQGTWFFRYKGLVYDVANFVPATSCFPPGNWDGCAADSFYSGILMRYTEDAEQVIVGTYL